MMIYLVDMRKREIGEKSAFFVESTSMEVACAGKSHVSMSDDYALWHARGSLCLMSSVSIKRPSGEYAGY